MNDDYPFDSYLVEDPEHIEEERKLLDVPHGCVTSAGNATVTQGFRDGRPCIHIHVPGEGLWMFVANR